MITTTTTVFWPIDVRYSGYCYGWVEPVLCVAGVAQVDSLVEAQELLNAICGDTFFMKYCGSDPTIIGSCQFKQTPPNDVSFSVLNDKHKSAPFTLSAYDLIYYHRHEISSMRFYSFKFIDLGDPEGNQDDTISPLYSSSAHSDFTSNPVPSGVGHLVLNQFNYAKHLESKLRDGVETQRRPRSWCTIDAFSLPFGLALTADWMTHVKTTITMSATFSSVLSSLGPLYALVNDMSATAQQVNIRLHQVGFLTRQSRLLLQSHKQRSLVSFSSQYVSFYSCVWLISNDVIVGTAFGAFLCENNIVLARLLNYAVESVLVNWVQHALLWLDSWPAGLKLNTELSRFYSYTFIDVIAVWGRVLHEGLVYLPNALYIIGILSSLGMTVAVSLFSDLLCLFTAHIYICYIISTAVYHHQLKTAGSLWNLFRGKRYNILRDRIDAWNYDVDQLLFGTILFTLVAFLFPTVLAYYALFAMMRLFIILIYASMETLLAFMNHFPLFAVALRVKDPWRLPGGLYFLKSSSFSKDSILMAQNKPIPVSYIFSQYIRLWSRLSSHYHPIRLLLYLLLGGYLAAIPQYPIRYVSITDPGWEK